MRRYACLAFAPASSLARCWRPRHPPPFLSTPSSRGEAAAFQLVPRPPRRRRRPSPRHLGVMRGAGAERVEPASSELEIEKKFEIPDGDAARKTEEALASLGFRISRREVFVDWYFDLPAPEWHFTLMDCWFRYREKKVSVGNNWGWRGAWQVKRGAKEEEEGSEAGARENDGMTVYEELQGKDAKKLILDMIAELGSAEAPGASNPPPSSACDSRYGGYDIPYLAGAECLAPFARLETSRICYEATNGDGEFGALKVDIDKTDFGYMVGEVEAVLDDVSGNKAKVESAKENIRKLVDLISIREMKEDESSSAAIGKLEYYLINNQRDHYDACVKSGAMMN
mmetsp:Transcript_8323/g.17981  ORF Transcript_8323/g.17981 Transcript_8323/m.17981 type:complete len:341 (-) Transcript_8323:2-1024(-)